MNQNAPIEERTAQRPRPAASAPPAGSVSLSPEGRALLRALTEGDMALARRKDLGELLRRLQAAAAPEAAAVTTDRLERLEGSLNRIDGALRIELAPILKAAVADGLAQHKAGPVRRRRGLVLLFVAGLALGIFGGPTIKDAALRGWQAALPFIVTHLPPNWGIRNSGNQIE